MDWTPLTAEPSDPTAWVVRDGDGRQWTYHRPSNRWAGGERPPQPHTYEEKAAGGWSVATWDELPPPLRGRRLP